MTDTKPTVGADVVTNLGDGTIVYGKIMKVHSDSEVDIQLVKERVQLDPRPASPVADDFRNVDAHKFRFKVDLGSDPTQPA